MSPSLCVCVVVARLGGLRHEACTSCIRMITGSGHPGQFEGDLREGRLAQPGHLEAQTKKPQVSGRPERLQMFTDKSRRRRLKQSEKSL